MSKTRKEQLLELLESMPEDAELNYFLAMEQLSEGDEEGAEKQLQHLIQIESTYVPTYLQLGQLYQRQGEEEKAKEVYQTGIALARQQNNVHAADEMSGFLAMLD